ncbi:MAG: glycosyltransferase family 4 protein [Dehalococcoidia bacterium]
MSRPLIAFDVTMAPARPTGGSLYALNLARALPTVDRDHDYVIYAKSHSLPLLEGVPATIVDVGPLRRLRRYVWEQFELPADLKRRGVSLLHSPHYTLPLRRPCPCVVTVHDLTFFLLPGRFRATRRVPYQLATFAASRLADRIIVPSESTAADLRRVLKTRASKIVVTPEGAGPEFRPVEPEEAAEVAAKYGLKPGYLLSLGTREPNKNRGAIIRALHFLVSGGRDLQLAVVGGGGWRTETEQAAIEGLGLTRRIDYTGYVEQEDLPALYSAAGVFLFPSLHEGFGLAALEAMACGVPVVTSNTSSLPEVVGDAALMVNPQDPRALADAVARILDDPALAARLREDGPRRAAAFTWEACAEKTIAVYRELLGEATATPLT